MPRDPIPPGTLHLFILRTLARGGELHGFEIADSIERQSGEVLTVEEGSLYPALQRMLKDGWVEAEWGMSARNRRVRIYRLTRAGGQHLKREVSSLERMLQGIARVLAPARS